MAAGITTDESKVPRVADGNRSPSMRARTPTKLDSFARCRAPHHDPSNDTSLAHKDVVAGKGKRGGRRSDDEFLLVT